MVNSKVWGPEARCTQGWPLQLLATSQLLLLLQTASTEELNIML
jgi:hypothetical protein